MCYHVTKVLCQGNYLQSHTHDSWVVEQNHKTITNGATNLPQNSAHFKKPPWEFNHESHATKKVIQILN